MQNLHILHRYMFNALLYVLERKFSKIHGYTRNLNVKTSTLAWKIDYLLAVTCAEIFLPSSMIAHGLFGY